ncbi:MAG: ATP-binding protein [Planctomycetota bacterium]
MSWQGIEGHDAVVARLAAAATAGRIGGAYLFVGPGGIGKERFALALAKALQCRSCAAGLVPCGVCPSCVQADAGSHPDIDVVRKPEDKATIPLESLIGDDEHRMRDGLCWRLLLKPIVGPRRVAILLDADHLAVEGANCLLKTLEEPPPGAVVILVGSAVERQLPTIRSRCQIVRFAPLPDATVAALLRRLRDEGRVSTVADEVLAEVASRSGGSVARGCELADPALADTRRRIVDLLGRRPLPGVELARETLAAAEAAGKDAAPRRQRLRLLFEAAVDFYRSALRSSVTAEGGPTPDLARAVAAWNGATDEAAACVQHTLDAIAAVDHNAHLPTLVDAWSAALESPYSARLA